MLPDADGIGEPRLPGAAFVEPGIAGDIEPPGIGEMIGFGAMVIGVDGVPICPPDDPPIELPPLDDAPPIELPPDDRPPIAPWPIEPAIPGLPPPVIAVARQTYLPVPLPYCAAPFM